MRFLLNIIITTLVSLSANAQMFDPVHFTSELRMRQHNEGDIIFSATIDGGWHVYSNNIPEGGPTPASFHKVTMKGMETAGALRTATAPVKVFDEMFQMEVRYFEHKVTFIQPVRFTAADYSVDCYLEYGACNDEMCLPPTEVRLTKSGKYPYEEEKTKTKEEAKSIGTIDSIDTIVTIDTIGTISTIDTIKTTPPPPATPTAPLKIFLLGILGGLLAVLMPCIWPVIPMTVSFFIRRSEGDSHRGLRDALLYGASIIVIYVSAGFIITLLFGSDALNALSTSAAFNIALFLLLTVFALSLFGVFDISLPSSWSTALDKKATDADKTTSATSHHASVIPIFLMALTLVIVSFSCTAPIIGLLLVQTATSSYYMAPLIGMTGFALALAAPFTLFALFPAWMSHMPRSGGWMDTLKVALAFIELAFALKFLITADQAYGWNLISRQLFFLLWIILFAMLGVYLLYRCLKESKILWRTVFIVCGVASLELTAYMIPGLWGAPCTLVSAFAPPMESIKAQYNDYDEAIAAARREKKPLLIDFTGYGCVNCRKMEAAVWTDPEVARVMRNDFIIVSLYVDDKSALPSPITMTDAKGNKKTLRTVGAKWSYLQSNRFNSNAQPYYIIVDAEGKAISSPRGYDEDIEAYINWLNAAATLYRQQEQP
ncbi:MAG: thioredoxin family protein [Prevotella sp.]|nr:thioredoxin family protein [Prevotella sp.]